MSQFTDDETNKVVLLDSERQTRSSPTPLSILFVEDDEIDAQLIEMALRKSAWFTVEITRARTIAEAKNFFQVAEFDIMLLDFWLGPDNGLELLDELGGRHSSLPVVLLTGYSNQDIQRIGHSAGALSFLSKDDVSANTLDAVMRSTLHTHHLESQLLASINERDAALRTQFDSIGSTSRKLNQPLQHLDDAAEAICALGPGGDVGEYVRHARLIAENVKELRKTTLELLDRLRAEHQHIDLSLEVVDLRELINKSIRLASGQLAERDQSIAFANRDIPVVVKADLTALLQALLNVISNAGKFSGAGTQVIISLFVHDGDAVATIEDSGVGMTTADIDRALRTFAGAGREGGSKSGQKTTRLGLPIAAGIVRQHGGTIVIDSTQGDGTKVTLTLPLYR